jgi:hypothetical protein
MGTLPGSISPALMTGRNWSRQIYRPSKRRYKMACGQKCEVYSRVVGYFRPVANWNIGKKEEFKDRVTFDNDKALLNEFAKEVEVKV